MKKTVDEIVSHVLNKTKCIDNSLLWADNLHGSFDQAVNWLDLWTERHHPQPGEIRVRSQHSRVCGIRDHQRQCQAMQEIPRCNPPLPDTQ